MTVWRNSYHQEMLTTPLAIWRAATVSSSQSLTFHPKTLLDSSGFNREGVHTHTRKQSRSNTDITTQSSEGHPRCCRTSKVLGKQIIITFHLPFGRMVSSSTPHISWIILYSLMYCSHYMEKHSEWSWTTFLSISCLRLSWVGTDQFLYYVELFQTVTDKRSLWFALTYCCLASPSPLWWSGESL